MALITQADMKQLLAGNTIVDGASMDVLTIHLPNIALAALGDDREALSVSLRDYADELDELIAEASFFTPKHRETATNHVQWLRSL